MGFDGQPRSIVRGKDYQRLAIELEVSKGIENCSNACIEFLDDISVAIRSILGVRMTGLPKHPKSPQPKSSQKITMMLGLESFPTTSAEHGSKSPQANSRRIIEQE
jgi:hypothetical protein